jgi:hypothetical protein
MELCETAHGISRGSSAGIARFVCVLLALCTIAVPLAHSQSEENPPQKSEPQSAPPPSPRPAAPDPTAGKKEEERAIERKEQSRRVLGIFPQFGVTSSHDAKPLSPHQKFNLFAKSAIDPVTVGIVGLQAGVSQAQNTFPAYGQGAEGYGKRFGAAFADSASAGFWSNFAYPSLLKEDPRYFRLGEGSFRHRVLYGVKEEFVCHTDKGGRAFNFSNVLGAFTSGAISNLYYPGKTLIRTIPATDTSPAVPVYKSERGVELTLSRAGIALAYSTLGGLFDEFWPDIERKVFQKHKKPVETKAP